MTSRKGCQRCRERHRKCVILEGGDTCTRCYEDKRSCEFGPRYRFRQTSYVDTSSQGERARTHFIYDEDQVWVSTRNSLCFMLEDGVGPQYDSNVLDAESTSPSNGIQVNAALQVVDLASTARTDTQRSIDESLTLEPTTVLSTLTAGSWIPEHPSATDVQIASGSNSFTANYATPPSIAELERRHAGYISASTVTPATSLSNGGEFCTISPTASLPVGDASHGPKLSRREAFLTLHFIQKIAPWIDCCDLSDHFTFEVPTRALQKPMVLYAILALASKHQSILHNHQEHEASFYHGECVRLIIEALSESEANYDDNLLCTVVLLRIYEEIEQPTDRFLHLEGTGRLLDAIPTFAHSGGLAEAACWQSLRQSIFVSLVSARPPMFRLELYDQSCTLDFQDEPACANTIVLLFAKILRLTYARDDHLVVDSWAGLEASTNQWHERRMRLFRPIYEEDAESESDQPFPVIYMTTSRQVVALQYFICCKIFLSLYKPENEILRGYPAVQRRRTINKIVVKYLFRMVGVAVSNDTVENANFMAHHMLRMFGYLISNTRHREQILDFLVNMQKRMGWSTADTTFQLKSQWDELGNPND